MVRHSCSEPGGPPAVRPESSQIRSVLLEQRGFRREQLRELAAAPGTGPLSEVTEALRTAARSALAEVDAALARLDSGTYGLCLWCEEQILPERLEIVPMAALCMACQRRAEQSAV